MEFLIGIFVGFISCGILVCIAFRLDRKKSSGTFIIDFSDPMKDICRLELSESIDSIYEKKEIKLDIKTISQQ